MEWEELAKGGCKNVLANGKQCGGPIDGRGGRLYCSDCRKPAWKKAKSQRDAERRKRDDERAEDNYYHWLYYHGLTEHQLSDRVANAPSLCDLWPAARDDQHEFAISQLEGIQGQFLHDPLPLPEVLAEARSSVHAIINQLGNRRAKDYIADRLLATCQKLDCSMGEQLYSPRAFGPLGKRIVTAQEAWRDQGDLINLTMVLCIRADFCRARFFQEPNHHKHRDDADRWLDTALRVLKSSPKQGELAVLRMSHTCIRGKFRIKVDQGAEATELKDEIDRLRALAEDIGDPKIAFLTTCYETEWALYAGDTAQAAEYLTRVEEQFHQLGINPFCLREYTVRLKPILAHKQGRFDERDAYFREYVTLFKQEPTIHGYHHLQELRQLYRKLPKRYTFKTRPRLYVNLLFTGIQEDLITF